MDVRQIAPAEALILQAGGALLIDVREHDEWDAGHAPGAIHIPVGELGARWREVPDAATTVFVCRSGARSQQAALAFAGAGRTGCCNLAGGMQAWHAQMLAIEPADGRII